mmetsp:Transcript_2616/g.6901  ORF Transcript_2616/g.6901 Transcript_2616/m.6901 type:complete len:230 (-) Transcript_2616:440-1129(-)
MRPNRADPAHDVWEPVATLRALAASRGGSARSANSSERSETATDSRGWLGSFVPQNSMRERGRGRRGSRQGKGEREGEENRASKEQGGIFTASLSHYLRVAVLVKPPSIGSREPVTMPHSPDKRNRIGLTTSSTSANRPSGILLSIRPAFAGSLQLARPMAVSTTVGLTALHLMPYGPSSRALIFVSMSSPAFEAQYAACSGVATRDACELTLTMLPLTPRSRMLFPAT